MMPNLPPRPVRCAHCGFLYWNLAQHERWHPVTMPDRPLEITAVVPGRCQCCNTPYVKGDRLRQEFGKWVLIDHPNPEQPRAQRPGLHDQFPMGRKNN